MFHVSDVDTSLSRFNAICWMLRFLFLLDVTLCRWVSGSRRYKVWPKFKRPPTTTPPPPPPSDYFLFSKIKFQICLQKHAFPFHGGNSSWGYKAPEQSSERCLLEGVKNCINVQGECINLEQCFSTFVRLRPGKFCFYKTRAQSQQIIGLQAIFMTDHKHRYSLSRMLKYFDVWKFPIIHEYFHVHWHLQHRCYLGLLGLSFSTHSRILFSSEYFHYKIFIHEECIEN
jgi:hypothetical protein